MAKQTTREKILESGIGALYHKGYTGSGLNEILRAARVPKGSFYYFFESKEDFAQQALQRYNRNFDPFFEDCFECPDLSPAEQLRRFFEHSISRLEGIEFSGGCLVGNLAQELSDTNPVIRAETEAVFVEWHARIADCLIRSQTEGQLSDKYDAEAFADFILNGWEGAMLRMKTTRSSAPLKNFVQHLFAAFFEPSASKERPDG